MKSNIIILFLLLNIKSFSQDDPGSKYSIYIFTRSTELKAAYIAKDFNIVDSLSTHIGIGFRKNGEYEIYNVTNDKTINSSALLCENLDSFINVNGLKYYSIWEYKTNSEEIDIIYKILNEYIASTIVFDYDFFIESNNKLYCSEFVYDVLQKTNVDKFYYKPIKVDLNQFYRRVLNRSNLEYIPVDFFRQMNLFKKIHENYLQNINED